MKTTSSPRLALFALALTAAMGTALIAGNDPRPASFRHTSRHPGAAEEPEPIEPANFTTNIDNVYFPLVPGTTYIYQGTIDRSPTRDEFTVTHDTVVIMGVTCRTIHDQAFVDGVLAEDTFDWFAQDDDGNVWYFGEDTKELDPHGNVISTEGSWLAGSNGALPGIIMEAHPRVGDTYRQEFAEGVAEDMATILKVSAVAKVPFGMFKNCLQTRDFTPLEPDVVENKFYAPGIGFIRSVMVKGGKEKVELVAIVQGP